MKKTLVAVAAALAFVGCARFSTTQTDVSLENPNGTTTRTITTKAASYTFFSSDSSLARWKASQTDKTQGAEVGNLAQHADATNVNAVIESVVGAAVKAAVAVR